jgi:hypothetical protein
MGMGEHSILRQAEHNLEQLINARLPRRSPGRLNLPEVARKLLEQMLAERRLGAEKIYVANYYRLALNDQDYEPFAPLQTELEKELTAFLAAAAQQAGFYFMATVSVDMLADASLGRGAIRIESEFGTLPKGTSHAVTPLRGMLFGEMGEVLGRTFQLYGDVVRIGRHPDCDIQLTDPGVSGHHAALSWNGNSYEVEDTQSRNGLMVNDERLAGKRVLVSGDRLQVGHSSLQFELFPMPPEAAPWTRTEP